MTVRNEGPRALELRLCGMRMHEEREGEIDALSAGDGGLQLACGFFVLPPVAAMQSTVKPSALQVRDLSTAVDQLRPYRDRVVMPPHGHEIDGVTFQGAIAFAACRRRLS